jgi:hypothetical protein
VCKALTHSFLSFHPFPSRTLLSGCSHASGISACLLTPSSPAPLRSSFLLLVGRLSADTGRGGRLLGTFLLFDQLDFLRCNRPRLKGRGEDIHTCTHVLVHVLIHVLIHVLNILLGVLGTFLLFDQLDFLWK